MLFFNFSGLLRKLNLYVDWYPRSFSINLPNWLKNWDSKKTYWVYVVSRICYRNDSEIVNAPSEFTSTHCGIPCDRAVRGIGSLINTSHVSIKNHLSTSSSAKNKLFHIRPITIIGNMNQIVRDPNFKCRIKV